MIFSNPGYLWFFMTVPALLVIHFISVRKVKRSAIMFSNYEAMEKVFGRKILGKNYPLLFLRLLTLILIIFAVSGLTLVYESVVGDLDFALAIDASASMMAQDYQPDRISAAKDAAQLFVDSVPIGTQISVVSFAGAGFVKQELTSNRQKLKDSIEAVGIEFAGGTAIGDAVITSVNTLMAGSKGRVVILLTDGQNNIGPTIDEAVAYAKRLGATVNTVGIGTEEGGIVANTSYVAGLDSETLGRIASQTGGEYMRAADRAELEAAYWKMATSTRKEVEYDMTFYLLLGAVLIFIAELVLLNSKYRVIP